MKWLLTGATGYLGGFLMAEARAAGDRVIAMTRRAPGDGTDWLPFDLAAPPTSVPQADVLVHAAFDHLPGRYRGGEGDDPSGFLSRNRDGSLTLFDAAERAGIGRIVFISSRAIYGAYCSGTVLTEDLVPRPDTLYGQMKAELEADLAARAAPTLTPVSLRVTGVYGQVSPGAWHKWVELFDDFAAGRAVAPRRGTEVHGADMASALRHVIEAPASAVSGRAFNVSDLMLDRHDLLAALAARRAIPHPPPPHAAGPAPNAMATDRLRALGWTPGGAARLHAYLDTLTP